MWSLCAALWVSTLKVREGELQQFGSRGIH